MPYSYEHAKEVAGSLAESYINASLSNLRLIEGRGEVNQVYEIVAGRQKAVLRINDHAEYARYEKEQWCISAARAKGVPTPNVFCIGRDDECSYMLLEFVEGDNGPEINDTNDTWYALGKYLHLIHDIPVKGFGDNLMDITTSSSVQWKTYVQDNIRSLGSDSTFIDKELLTRAQAAKVQELFRNQQSKSFNFGLNHGDYSLANVMLNNVGVPNIIDWGSAQAHIVPHHDLAIILEESLDEDSDKYAALLSGYGMIRKDYVTIKSEIQVLQLLDVVDKIRWARDQSPQRLKYHVERLAKFVEKAEI